MMAPLMESTQVHRCELQRRVHGAWCMVHGALCMVHGAWCIVHGAWCMVHCALCMVHGALCMVHGAWCMVQGSECGCCFVSFHFSLFFLFPSFALDGTDRTAQSQHQTFFVSLVKYCTEISFDSLQFHNIEKRRYHILTTGAQNIFKYERGKLQRK